MNNKSGEHVQQQKQVKIFTSYRSETNREKKLKI